MLSMMPSCIRFILARIRSISSIFFWAPPGLCLGSDPVTAATSAAPVNSWARLWPSRFERASFGYGVAAPAVGRPHLSPGTQDPLTRAHEPVGPRADASRFSDGPTAEAALRPSARRGHSLSALNGVVYLFGGLAEGYKCSRAVTDTRRFGGQVERARADPSSE